MLLQLKGYQEMAIKGLLEKAKELLRHGLKTLVFKAPTGSGKTIMMADFLKRLADDPAGRPPLAFIWTAPRKLHEQSHKTLMKYFEDSRALECSFFEDLDDRQIGENEILFFNWESINKRDAIYIQKNEQENNLSAILERTRDEGRKIVLIVDESHFAAGTRDTTVISAARKLRQDIAPDLTIEVSATPRLQGDDSVNVQIESVKAEAMIKKSVALNDGFKNIIGKEYVAKDGSKMLKFRSNIGSTDEKVLDAALKKRVELAMRYRAAGADINPLLLIQLPDRRGQDDENLALRVERVLKDMHGISIENGKLAVKLSGREKNWENIEQNEGEQEVLIFKHSIALGWDCPRAQVLALFREWKSAVFSVQTVGRIMRMPEPDRGAYYDDDILNYAYVYTDLESVEIQEDISGGYITIYTSKCSKHAPVHLPSVHSKRMRERTRLSPLYTTIFLALAKEYTSSNKKGLAKIIKTRGQHAQLSLISDWRADNIDKAAGVHVEANMHLDAADDMQFQSLLNYFVRKNLSPFYAEDRSVGRMKETIYQFFKRELGMEKMDYFRDIISIVLSEDNRQHFEAVIDAAKKAYKAETEKRERELIEDVWDVPEYDSFSEECREIVAKKSIMQPCYINERSRDEHAFVEFLDRPRNEVVWWYKNRERDSKYFAVPYSTGDDKAPFYVDFVVMMKDGSINLFDPHGIHLADFGPKSDGLRAYIAVLKKKGRKISGGIVANTGSRNFSGRWMLYDGPGKDAREGNWTNWNQL